MFFVSWESIIRTALSTVMAYALMIFMLRLSGKRTLAKMNAYDFIVTIALGSSFATVALSKDVAISDGAVVFLLLILMQYIITWLSVRNSTIKNLMTSQPTLLLYKGELFDQLVKKERITIDEIYTAMRKVGIAELKDVDIIVLETTGDITVVGKITGDIDKALKDVGNFPPEKQ